MDNTREKLIELIQSAVDGCATYWAERIADHLIASGVEIPVRCKECKKWLKVEPSGTNCRYCAISRRSRLPYDFCSYGERRAEDGK